MRVTKAVGVGDMRYYVMCLTGEERDAVLDLVRSTLNKDDYPSFLTYCQFHMPEAKEPYGVHASLNRKLTAVEKKLELPSRSYNQAERFVS